MTFTRAAGRTPSASVIDVANSSGDVAAIISALAGVTSGGVASGTLTTAPGKVARITTATTLALGYTGTTSADWSTTTSQKVKLALDILPDAGLGAALTIKGGYGVELDLNVLGGGLSASVTDAAMTTRTTSADGHMTALDPTNVLTSATAAFTSADVATSVIVPGAGASGAALYTSISSVTNSTTAVLAATAQTTVTTAVVVIGSLTVSSPNAIAAGLTAGAVVSVAGAGPSPEGVVQPLMASVRSVNAGAGTFVLSEGCWAAVTGATLRFWDVAVRLEDHVGLKLNIYGKAYAGCLVAADAADDTSRRIRSVSFGRIHGNQNGMTVFWKRMEAHGSLGQIWSNSTYGDYFGLCDDLHWSHYEGGVGSSGTPSAVSYLWFDRCNQLNSLSISVGDRATEAAVKMTAGSGNTSGDIGRFTQIRCTNYQATATATTTNASNSLTSVVTLGLTLKVGQAIVGAGIPDGATITAVSGTGNGYTAGSPGTVTISTNATASASGVNIYGLTSDGLKLIGIKSLSVGELDTAKCVAGLRVVGGGDNGITVRHKSLTGDLCPLVVSAGTTSTTPRVDVIADYRFVLGYVADLGSGLTSGADIRLSGYSEGMHQAYGASGRYAVRSASSAAVLDIDGHRQKARTSLTGFVDTATVTLRGRPGARLENDTPIAGKIYVTDGSNGFSAATFVAPTVSTAQTVLTNTTTDTVVAGPLTIPANTVAAGTTYRMQVWGNIDNAAAASITLRVRVGGLSGTSLWAQAITSASLKTTQAFNHCSTITFRAAATSSTATTVGGFIYNATAGSNNAAPGTSANLNMTVDRDLVMTAVWAGADVGNVLRVEGFMIEKVA